MKLGIAYTGKPRVGKETVIRMIAKCAADYSFSSSVHGFRDPLRETADLVNRDRQKGFSVTHAGTTETLIEILENVWGIPADEYSVLRLTTVLGDIFGYDTELIDLKNREREYLQQLFLAMQSDRGFGEGVLTRAILNRLIKSPADIPQVDGVRMPSDEKALRKLPNLLFCYITASFDVGARRAKIRRRGGEENKSLEELRREEQVETEVHIEDIGSRADFQIVNNFEPDDPESEESRHLSLLRLERVVRQNFEEHVLWRLKRLTNNTFCSR